MASKNVKAAQVSSTQETTEVVKLHQSDWTTSDVDISDIVTTSNSRQRTDGPELAELKKSMASTGQLVPVVLARTNDQSGKPYQLVAGHRRLAAAKALGWTTIRAQYLSFPMSSGAWNAEIQAVENIERLQLTALEEAIAATELVERFEDGVANEYAQPDGRIDADAGRKMRHRAIAYAAERLGKTVKWVEDKTFIMQLPKPVRDLLHEGKLPMPHAREIAKVADHEEAIRIAETVKMGHPQGQWDKNPDPNRPAKSLDDVRKLVARTCSSLKDVPWKLQQPFDNKPACSACPKNAINASGLFGGFMFADKGYMGPVEKALPAEGLCTDLGCYQEKMKASKLAASAAARNAIKQQITKASVTVNGKPPQPPKDFVPKATPTAVAAFVPDFVEPKFVVEKAREAVERATEKKKPVAKTAAKSEPSTKQKAERALADAVERWAKEMSKWAKPMAAQLDKMLEADPILDMKIQILNTVFSSGPLDLTGCSSMYRPKAPAAVIDSRHTALIACATAQDPAHMKRLIEELRTFDKQWNLYCSRGMQLDGIFLTVAAPWILDDLRIKYTTPLPMWSDFDPTAKKHQEKPATNPAKKAAKKGGRQ